MLLNLKHKIDSVFDELKDFQKITVDFAYKKLQENNRYLVADEVGLGKTKIAKGIIAKALQEKLESGSKKPFRVFYICSNQALAAQNLKDLNIFEDPNFINPDLNRLIYLAKKQDKNDQFSLSSLTPSTSFKITWGGGVQWERMLIYTVLSSTSHFQENWLKKGLKWLLIEGVTNWDNWVERVDWYYENYSNKIIKGLPEKYIKHLKTKEIPDELKECLNDFQDCDFKPRTLFGLVNAYCNVLSHKQKLEIVNKEFPSRNKLLIHLRKALIEVSLEYLQADLFILDEFQRFKELTGQGVNKESEAAQIANKIFSIEGAKCLLLSATPFKLYTTRFDEMEEDHHYAELLELLKFLHNNDTNKKDDFEKLRKKYFQLIKNLDHTNPDFEKVKLRLENAYKEVMCRTEKIIVSKNHNSLIAPKDKADSDVHVKDIENFVHTDRTFQTLINKHNQKIRYSIDYSKSVPYPLSFMDGYESKRKFNDFMEQNHIEGRRLIKANKSAWINMENIDQYQKLEIPNAKFRQLQQESLDGDDMWKLLWLPPSVPYYPGMGVYESKSNLSKVLIFSKWVMVPKMISSLLSYELERKTIPKFIENANYFVSKKGIKVDDDTEESESRERRKPLPVLRLQLKEKEVNTMRSFTLLYPSKTLTELFNLANNSIEQQHYKEIRKSLIEELDRKLTGIKSQYEINNREDKNWYWVAPILLDKMFHHGTCQLWIDRLYNHSITQRKYKGSEGEKRENTAALKHLQKIADTFSSSPEELNMGTFPANLSKVLVDIAMGSPANCLYRLFLRYFEGKKEFDVLNAVLEIAYDFMLFFDKPEAIAAVQLNELEKDNRFKENKEKVDIYWNLVLRYCIDGNLQSVLDEYGHMLIAKNKSVEGLTQAIISGLNLRTSMVKVEGLRNSKLNQVDSRSLRCHYAISFGNQKLETDEGRNRAGEVINNFNSPFRPFVLASTSLGQEGLDFHYYCRKIMHWNLPYNPVELEQREGRINRYKGLVIRQNIAAKFKEQLKEFSDVWEELFAIAEEEECKVKKKAQIIPYWFIEPESGINIERIVPLLAYSIDLARYKELISILALYRLTFGQPGQEELVNIFKRIDFNEKDIDEIYNKMVLNLSPLI